MPPSETQRNDRDISPQILITCRSQRWWGQIRQSRLIEGAVPVRFLPDADSLIEASRGAIRSFSLVEIPRVNPESLLAGVQRLTRRPAFHTVLGLGEPDQIGWEFAFREAGATDFLFSVADFGRLHRSLDGFLRSLSPLRSSWDEAIIQRLPWRSMVP